MHQIIVQTTFETFKVHIKLGLQATGAHPKGGGKTTCLAPTHIEI
jgi:hypothetical protein